MTDPQSGVTSYAYDTLNRLASLSNPQSQQFGFSYDSLSRRAQMTRPNGVNTNYTYDSVSRLLSVLHQAGGVTLDGASYTVDAAGNRTSKTNLQNGVSENYTYDPLYQLTQVVQGANTTESYSYDGVGNRLSSFGISPYSYNNSNELTGKPGVSYTYDNNGNTLTKTDSNGTTSYVWDFENRLVSVTLPGTGGTVTFKYDPFGRRIQKSGPSGTTNYLYDGANILEEVDATGTVRARYTQGAGIDEPLAMLRGGVTSYYQADGLGSVTSLTDTTGALAATYTYDTFGNLTASTGTLANPIRYTGRELDSETGLYYYRARYYDGNVSRFISQDPTGFRGGPNFYTYAINEPTKLVDPWGLKCTQVTPWDEIPAISGVGPRRPISSSPAGLDWHSKPDWGIITAPGYVEGEAHTATVGCYCDWWADHYRVLNTYLRSETQGAWFECEPCRRREYRTRSITRTFQRYEQGGLFIPTQRKRLPGVVVQKENHADDPSADEDSWCTACLSPPR